ncbi:MAG: hypothetical protein K9H61_02260 [Bacteroidia bacterium]|nr:hypothetical protein [Bacteroidia bacterium]MCF8427149.1 hypothetical protein [Bacteroidia bacterium]MCF8445794.1 hypothetical protein [Bacteroidia bacterium]
MSITFKITFALIALVIMALAKAISDRIGWGNLFAKFKFWSRENTGIKDKNQDGKITVQEQFFPVDGWHLMEWFKILPFSFYVSLDLCKDIPVQIIFKNITWYNLLNHWFVIYLLVPIGITAIYNFVFLITYGLLPRITTK